jgi:hypothetical protein
VEYDYLCNKTTTYHALLGSRKLLGSARLISLAIIPTLTVKCPFLYLFAQSNNLFRISA